MGSAASIDGTMIVHFAEAASKGTAIMGSLHLFAAHKLFDPQTAEAMGLAFDTAWQKLLVSGSELASAGYAEATGEALAMHIIDLAKTGERDVNRLREDAVSFVLQTLEPHAKSA